MTDEPEWKFGECEFPTSPPPKKKRRRKKISTTPAITKSTKTPLPEGADLEQKTYTKRMGKREYTFYYYKCPGCTHETVGSLSHLGAYKTIVAHIVQAHKKGSKR